MGIVTLVALEILEFEFGRLHPFAAPDPVSACQPVVVYQPMAAGTQLLHIGGHDPGTVVGSVFIAILDEVAVVASIIGAVIQFYGCMGKRRLHHIRIGQPRPIRVTQKTVSDHDFVLQILSPGGVRRIPARIERFGDRLFCRCKYAQGEK